MRCVIDGIRTFNSSHVLTEGGLRRLLPIVLLAVALVLPHAALADSLWLGTDNTNIRSVLNTDLAGNVLQSVGPLEASGIAINGAANLIYFGTAAGTITGRSLSNPGTVLVTLNPPTQFGEDMAFDGAFLWRVDINAQKVDKIDLAGNIVSSFDPGFIPLGLAWDGSDLWVSEFTNNGLVKQFTTAGVATGNQFNAPTGGDITGGLAWDTSNSTLWIGTFGNVYHSTTAGVGLGSFAVSDGRFVDGLEFQTTASSVPEPTSFLLLASVAAIVVWKRSRALAR